MEKITTEKIKNKNWWSYLEQNHRELLEESLILLEREERLNEGFHDYAFVVFPAAKAYEGFLKKILLELGFITRADFEGDHFRIGRSLNPSLPDEYRGRDWVYLRLAAYCGGEELPKKLWSVWRESRNRLFHWFPKEANAIGLDAAREKVSMIIDAIDAAFEGCRVRV